MRATSPAVTAPGVAFSGGVTVIDTCTFAPGSKVVTTSDNVSHEPGPDALADFAYATVPPGRAVASTAANRTVTRNDVLRLVTTNARFADAPGSISNEPGAPT